MKRVHEKILTIPLGWLKDNIEIHAEKYLNQTTDDLWEDYTALIQLYSQIDSDLALRLAERAIGHEDPHVRDVGEAWKAQLLKFDE